MTLTIDAVPDRITRGRLVEVLGSLGIDAMHVAAPGVTIGFNSIECNVYALNEHGKLYVDNATGEIAQHTVRIPVVDPD